VLDRQCGDVTHSGDETCYGTSCSGFLASRDTGCSCSIPSGLVHHHIPSQATCIAKPIEGVPRHLAGGLGPAEHPHVCVSGFSGPGLTAGQAVAVSVERPVLREACSGHLPVVHTPLPYWRSGRIPSVAVFLPWAARAASTAARTCTDWVFDLSCRCGSGVAGCFLGELYA
jgi:hypothetical protein